MTYDKHDPMNQFRSVPKRHGEVISVSELKRKKDQHEWSHQLKFCKWLKLQYPYIKFRSDIQSAGKLSGAMQNIKQIIDPYKGWPDIAIYHRSGIYCGLHIEMKRENSGTFLKDGTLSKYKHVQDQAEMHAFLRSIGYKVEIAEGFEEAKRIFEEYLKL